MARPRLLRLRRRTPARTSSSRRSSGGKRDFQGLEFVFRKRFSDNWQLLVVLQLQRAKGNTNSDSNADFQGDVLFLDPRAPNQYGTQPGLIRAHHQGRRAPTRSTIGLQLGAAAIAGTPGRIASRTFLDFEPQPADAGADGRGIRVRRRRRTLDGAGRGRHAGEPEVGTARSARAVQAQLRPASAAEFFVDMFNVIDNQASTREQDLVAGQGGVAFGQGLIFNPPRRAFFGTRLRF